MKKAERPCRSLAPSFDNYTRGSGFLELFDGENRLAVISQQLSRSLPFLPMQRPSSSLATRQR
jgi:hypothetical protein